LQEREIWTVVARNDCRFKVPEGSVLTRVFGKCEEKYGIWKIREEEKLGKHNRGWRKTVLREAEY
jgi:hypothetical protein